MSIDTSPAAVEALFDWIILHKRSVLAGMTRREQDEFTEMFGTARAIPEAAPVQGRVPFQSRVEPWLNACFGARIASDRLERGDRFLEEVFELLQSGNYPRERIAQLSSYVWSRPEGEPAQEVGGVMVTLAAYCSAHGVDMHDAGEVELARVWTKVEKIRAKQATKPTDSALPQKWASLDPAEVQGWQPIETLDYGSWVIGAMQNPGRRWVYQIVALEYGVVTKTGDAFPATHWRPLPAPPESP